KLSSEMTPSDQMLPPIVITLDTSSPEIGTTSTSPMATPAKTRVLYCRKCEGHGEKGRGVYQGMWLRAIHRWQMVTNLLESEDSRTIGLISYFFIFQSDQCCSFCSHRVFCELYIVTRE
ncbi:hypothetical protein GCK32_021408, partial [Trichostrongylus colubriformis]